MKEKKVKVYDLELKVYLIKTLVFKYRFTFFLCLLSTIIVIPQLSYAQSEIDTSNVENIKREPHSISYDSSFIDARIPDVNTIENYNNDPDFIYSEALENPVSLFGRIIATIFRLFMAIVGNPVGNFIFKAILIISIVAVVFLLLNQLLDGNLTSVFSRKTADKPISFQISEEELEEMNLEELKEKALKNSDFHSATRYVYLMTLKLLNQKELIDWKIEKTNLDYERELEGHPINPLFNKLTSFYEFVEYGDFDIDSSGYTKVDSLFDKLKALLSS